MPAGSATTIMRYVVNQVVAYYDGFPDYVQRLGLTMYLLSEESGKKYFDSATN